jgi:peptidoglycan hydrolase CwlO-like protein
VFFSSNRTDPFAAARAEVGLEPGSVERRSRRPGRTVAAALVVPVVSVALLMGTVSPASGAPDDMAQREAALRRATAERVEAEERVSEVTARLASVQEELAALGAADQQLTQELATARRKVREYAVAAYIDGGQTEIIRSSLSPEKAVALSWQSNMALGQSVSADEAAAMFELLKEANTPARLEAAARLDRSTAELEEARFDLIQAAAHERDAESALAAARRAAEEEQARRAEAERAAAADRVAADRRAAAATRAAAPARPVPGRSTAAPVARSGATGNPTAGEAATLARIRQCESGGNYSIVSSSGRYRGAYQFDASTWRSVGGAGDPAAAAPAEQDYRALLLLRQRGTRPWPHCGR